MHRHIQARVGDCIGRLTTLIARLTRFAGWETGQHAVNLFRTEMQPPSVGFFPDAQRGIV